MKLDLTDHQAKLLYQLLETWLHGGRECEYGDLKNRTFGSSIKWDEAKHQVLQIELPD